MDRKSAEGQLRNFVVLGLARIEDAVYAGLGVLLSALALTFLFTTFKGFVIAVFARALSGQVSEFLDQVLLILLIIELLYTVQVSFREHSLLVEPFLVVALIAVIRRILVLTAELPKLPAVGGPEFSHSLAELSLLTAMVVVLVAALILLQRLGKHAEPIDRTPET
jgi:uncharacterized membrane protein (DUF373 family)